MREVEEALATWRDAERRFLATDPASLAHAVAELDCNDARVEYDRLVTLRQAEHVEAELLTDEPATYGQSRLSSTRPMWALAALTAS